MIFDDLIAVLMWPHESKSNGDRLGEHGGYATNPCLPIHLFGKRHSRTVAHCCTEAGIFLEEGTNDRFNCRISGTKKVRNVAR